MTIQEIQDEIISESRIFQDYSWMDKYNYLVKIGKSLPDMDLKNKTENNLIKNCQSKVWVCADFKNEKVFYSIDSSSMVIRGIIVFLLRVLSGQKPEDIKNADLYFIYKVGFDEICSTGRINTFRKIVDKMKAIAVSHVYNQ